MTLNELFDIRDQISELLLDRVDGNVKDEHNCVTMASKQLEKFGGMGGSTRAVAEREIVRLVRRFDDPSDSSFGPWPVSDFMQTHDAQAAAYKLALESCISAHKSGQYEIMVAAIDGAENLIYDLTK